MARDEKFTQIDYVLDDGRIMEVEIRPTAEGGTVITFDDVTADREAQRRITELAFCDPLTKLANRPCPHLANGTRLLPEAALQAAAD